jgi:hypothetical protein
VLNPRKVCFVGRGHRLKVLRNVEMKRSFIYDEQIFFPVAPPYRAQLRHTCNADQTVASLKLQDGNLVRTSSWRFENTVDPATKVITASYLIIDPNDYSPTNSYYLSYQSLDPDVYDRIPFWPNDQGMEMRGVLAMGNEPNQATYIEDLIQYDPTKRGDYRIVMDYTPPADITDYPAARVQLADKYNMVPSPGYDDTPPRTEFVVDIDYHRIGYYTFKCTNIVTVGLTTTITMDITVPGSATVQTMDLVYTTTTDPDPATIDSQLTWNATRVVLNGFRYQTAVTNWVGAGTQLLPTEVTNVDPAAGIYSLAVTTNDGAGNLVIQVTPPGGAPVYSVGTTYNPADPPGTLVPVVIAPGLLDINPTVGTVLTWVAAVEAWDIELPTYFQVQIQDWGVLGYHVDGAGQLDWTYTAKDTRGTTFYLAPIGSVHRTGPLPTDPVDWVQFTYSSTTMEGGFGSVTVARDSTVWDALFALGVPDLAPGDFTEFDFKDGIKLKITDPDALVMGEKWVFTITNEHLVDWSPLAERTEIFSPDEVYTDALGTITGTPGAPYIILNSVPMQFNQTGTIVNIIDLGGSPNQVRIVTSVSHSLSAGATVTLAGTTHYNGAFLVTNVASPTTFDIEHLYIGYEAGTWTSPLPLDPRNLTIVDDLGHPVSYLIPHDNTGDVRLTSYSQGRTLTATYYTRGNEPAAGATYYGTFTVIRPQSDYNSVITSYSPDDSANLLGPMAVNNHLAIMAEIAWTQDTVPQAISWVQVKDEDSDGIYTTRDFANALMAVRKAPAEVTDIVVLSHFESLSDMKSTVIYRNDPFIKRVGLGWQGMPAIHFIKGSGQGIGSSDEEDAGSIIYTATNSLQTYNDSPGRGSFIEIANTWGKRTIVTEDGSTTQVLLDGSFLAGAAASLITSFGRPEETIIRRAIRGFDVIDTFDDSEILRVGAASTTYIMADGDNYIFGESVTVDKGEPALNEISGRTQEQFVTRYINAQVDQQLVGFVPENADIGAAIVQSFIASAIGQLLSLNYISDYLDETTRKVREFDPNTDVQAIADENDARIYYFNYFYFLRYPGKRFFGLYSVDRNLFAAQS